jgi:RNA polymerase sigma-70 factor (ECF subfamily)
MTELELPVEVETPESLLISQQETERIQTAIAQLTIPFREIILLVEVEEMSYQEISETLSIPIGTVMSRLSRARKALRGILLRETSEKVTYGL